MRMPTLPLVLGVALAACGRESPPAASAPPPSTAHATTLQKIDRLAATADSVSADSMKSLVGRLSYEAAHRPADAPRAEDVLAALERAGVRLDDHKQYVAATALASYCVGGQTATGLSVAVCEYESPAAATAGREHITARFQIPDLERVIHQRGATTLALGHHRDLKLASTVQTAAAAFSEL